MVKSKIKLNKLWGIMIGKNFIVKIWKNFENTMQKISLENSLSLPRIPKNTKIISFSYDVNDHVYFKLKFV